jgi:carbamoyltransferase
MANIGYYGSHNAAIAVEQNGKIISVIEFERFVGYKNTGVAQYKVVKHKSYKDLSQLIKYALQFIKEEYGIEHFENCIYASSDVIIDNKVSSTHLEIPANNYSPYPHHKAHAAGAFYQSSYNEALVFSFDGGGDDGKFNIFHCIRGEEPSLLKKVPCPTIEGHWVDYDLGFPYMLIGHYLKDINFEPLNEGNLVYAGKIMGLVSYGKVREEWIKAFMDYYKSDPQGDTYKNKIQILSENINIPFDINERLEGQLAYDIAATSQRAFEECFLEIANHILNLFLIFQYA